MLIVLTGKTASGKDTIKSKLLAKYPHFKKVITTTSRTKRSNEVDRVDYYFLSRDEFERKIKEGEFAEYVEYGGNLYGTYKSELEQAGDLMWRIDPSRAGKVRELIKGQNLVVIYITVSDDVILQRLKNRGLTDEEIQSRMTDDAKIWQKYQNNYDYVVENVPGKLDATLDKIVSIIQNHP